MIDEPLQEDLNAQNRGGPQPKGGEEIVGGENSFGLRWKRGCAVGALVALFLAFLGTVFFIPRFNSSWFMPASLGAIYANFAFGLLLATLVGRHWLSGFCAGIGMTFSTFSCVVLAEAITFRGWDEVGLLENYCYAWCVPTVLLVGGIPLTLMRIWRGWQFSSGSVTRWEPIRLDSLLLGTLIAAVCFILSRCTWRIEASGMALTTTATEFWLQLGAVCLVVAFLSLFVLLPVIWIYSNSAGPRLWLRMGVFAVSVATVVVVAILSLTRLAQAPMPVLDVLQLVGLLVPSFLIVLLVQLKLLSSIGLQFKSFARGNHLRGALTENELSPDFKTNYAFTYVLAGLVFVGTIVLTQWVSKREAERLEDRERIARQMELADRKGGRASLAAKKPEMEMLELWKDASTEEFAQFLPFDSLEFLELKDTDVDIGILQERAPAGLLRLHEIQLSGTNVTLEALRYLATKCPNLTKLTADKCSLSTECIELFKDRQFEELRLSGNRFDVLPAGELVEEDQLLRFVSAQVWIANDSGMTDQVANAVIGEVTTELGLAKNRLQGRFSFWDRVDSARIDLSGNPLDDQLFGRSLAGRNLPVLNLQDTKLTDAFLVFLAQAESIDGFYVSGMKITDEGLARCGQNPRLVSLTGCRVVGSCFQTWRPAIETLVAIDCPIADENLRYVAGLPKLKHLELIHTKVSASGLVGSPLDIGLELWLAGEDFSSVEKKLLNDHFENLTFE